MKRLPLLLSLFLCAPLSTSAQGLPPALSPVVQIASAVAPLPEEFRESTTVLGYATGQSGLTQLRSGTGPFVCLADDPASERFHVACYHRTLEPFMARGRQLRAQGLADAQVDSVRNEEIQAGTLSMPTHPAALYSLTGTGQSLDPTTGAITDARRLYVVYVPFATAESTGLPTKPDGNKPWLMSAGTPKAHIMFAPDM